jgi:tetratricopeptide (TPR) repeat protein
MLNRMMFVAAVQSMTPFAAWAADKPVIGPPAAWVKPTPLPTETGTTDAAAVRIILIDQQMQFGPDGDSLYLETAARIQTPQGLAPMGNFAVRWKPETDVVTVHKFQILRGKEVIDLLAKGPGFTILRREQNLEYAALDGALTATIQPEGLQVGDIVDIAYTTRRLDPLLRGHSGEIVASRTAAQVGQINITASWPHDKPMRIRPIAPVARPTIDATAGRFTLTARQVDPLVQPKGAPSRFWTDGQIEFSDYASWGDIAATFAPLYDAARELKPGSPLSAEIARIRATSADPVARTEAALALVQDKLRYIYLGLNDGHLKPMDADASWERRFGDCKAKTVLLLALLDGLGIPAEPALVNTRGGDGLDERLPAVDLFDHVIVRATIADKVYWLDGTRSGDRSLARLRIPPFHWALPLRSTGATLEPLVVPPLALPDETTDVHIDASAGLGQQAKALVEVVYAGDAAIATRFQLANLQPADLDRELREYWKGRYDFITPTTVSARFDEASATEHLLLDGLAKLDWNVETPPPYYEVDGATLGWRPDFAREPGPHRDAPFAMAYPSYNVRHETILLPNGGKGFWIESKDVDQTLAGFQFHRKTALLGNKLTMEASSRSIVPEISAAEANRSTDALRELSKRGAYLRLPDELVATLASRTPVLAANGASDLQKSAGTLAAEAERYLGAGDLDRAMRTADEATQLDPTLIGPYQTRARIHHVRGSVKEAGLEGDALIRAAAADTRALAAGGTILCGAGRQTDGLRAFERALATKPDDSLYLGRSRCRPPVDIAGRRADIDAALKLRPTSGAAWAMLGRLHRENGDHKAEIDALSKLVAADADNPFSQALLAGALARAGETDRARSTFATVRTKAAGQATVFNALCWEAATAGFDLAKAQADCKAATAARPDSATMQDSLGFVSLRLRRYEEAIAAYDIALKSAPLQATALYGRGLARRAKGLSKAADADQKRARELRSDIDATFRGYGM